MPNYYVRVSLAKGHFREADVKNLFPTNPLLKKKILFHRNEGAGRGRCENYEAGSQYQKQRNSPEQREEVPRMTAVHPRQQPGPGHAGEKVQGGRQDSGAQCLMQLNPSDVGEELEVQLVVQLEVQLEVQLVCGQLA